MSNLFVELMSDLFVEFILVNASIYFNYNFDLSLSYKYKYTTLQQ